MHIRLRIDTPTPPTLACEGLILVALYIHVTAAENHNAHNRLWFFFTGLLHVKYVGKTELCIGLPVCPLITRI